MTDFYPGSVLELLLCSPLHHISRQVRPCHRSHRSWWPDRLVRNCGHCHSYHYKHWLRECRRGRAVVYQPAHRLTRGATEAASGFRQALARAGRQRHCHLYPAQERLELLGRPEPELDSAKWRLCCECRCFESRLQIDWQFHSLVSHSVHLGQLESSTSTIDIESKSSNYGYSNDL